MVVLSSVAAAFVPLAIVSMMLRRNLESGLRAGGLAGVTVGCPSGSWARSLVLPRELWVGGLIGVMVGLCRSRFPRRCFAAAS